MKNFLFVFLCMTALAEAGCYKDSNYTPTSFIPKTIFKLSASPDSVPADGYTKINIIVSGLLVNTDDSISNAAFSTDYGVFTTTNTSSASEPWTYTYLRPDSIGRVVTIPLQGTIVPDSAHLSATINGVTVTQSLYFYRAFPDTLLITPSSYYISATDSAGLKIEVDMVKYLGTPSLHTPLNITVTDPGGSSVGGFTRYSNLSDSSGKCTFQYVITDPAYSGPLVINARTGANGKPISGSVTVSVTH